MRKIFKKLITVLCVCCLVTTTACSPKLSVPKGFLFDEDNLVLSWDKVDGASGYTVDISGKTYKTKQNSISLEDLDAGDYEIKVQADGKEGSTKNSDWAEYGEFTKDEESGFVYQLINNRTEYELVGGGKASGDVVIEDTFRGKPVTSIKASALSRNSKITSLVVGKNVKTIGKRAFYSMTELTSVSFKAGSKLTTIGENLLQSCKKLKKVSFPETLTELPNYTFSYCADLTDIELSEKITSIGAFAFAECTSLTEITLPEKLVTLGRYSFSGCTELTKVTMKDNLTTIGNLAFTKCSALKTVNFGKGLTDMGESTFYNCVALESITLPESLLAVGKGAFMGCTSLKSVHIGSGVRNIGYDAFKDTAIYAKESVDEDGNPKEIVTINGWILSCLETKTGAINLDAIGVAQSAFSGCEGITSVRLPKAKYIGNYAFEGCKKIATLILSDELEYIGENAFANCERLTSTKDDNGNYSLYLGQSLKEIGIAAFYNCIRLGTGSDEFIDLPDTVEKIGEHAFFNTGFYQSADTLSSTGIVYIDDWVVDTAKPKVEPKLNDNVRGIADFAFDESTFNDQAVTNCSKHPTALCLKLPDTVEYIGYASFIGTNLQHVEFSANLKKIGDFAFYESFMGEVVEADGITSTFLPFELPEGLTEIGRSAFYKNFYLTEINVPSTVTKIGDFAFYGMGGDAIMISVNEEDGKMTMQYVETKIEIADGEQELTIGIKAFYGCQLLVSMDLPDRLVNLGERAFYNCSSLMYLDIGSGLTEIPAYTFYQCISLINVVIPSNIKKIGKYAFKGCEWLTYLTIEEGVEEIVDYAFYKCPLLANVKIPTSVKSIGHYAFRNLGATAIVIPETVETLGKYLIYGNNQVTIYAESEGPLPYWNQFWNQAQRPIVWGCTLSADKSYVVSFVKNEGTIQNYNDFVNDEGVQIYGISAPIREGYTFKGWTTTEGGKVCEYTANEVINAPNGTTLYAIWVENQAEDGATAE